MIGLRGFATLICIMGILSCTHRITDPPPDDTGIPTEIAGTVGGVWGRSHSPYIVTGNLDVPEDSTLIIEPGVQLQFRDAAQLTIRGRILARGTATQPIVFTVAPGQTWRGIRINNSTAASAFHFCRIQEGGIFSADTSDAGILSIHNARVMISNSVFERNKAYIGGGVSVTGGAMVHIENNIFVDNNAVVYGGGIFVLEANAEIFNNTFYQNTTDNIGGSIVLFDPDTVNIQNNLFYQNSGRLGIPTVHYAQPDSGTVTVAYNFVDSQQSPVFASLETLRLQPTSPCVDAGNPDPQYNDTDGTRNDQGAYGGPKGNW